MFKRLSPVLFILCAVFYSACDTSSTRPPLVILELFEDTTLEQLRQLSDKPDGDFGGEEHNIRCNAGRVVELEVTVENSDPHTFKVSCSNSLTRDIRKELVATLAGKIRELDGCPSSETCRFDFTGSTAPENFGWGGEYSVSLNASQCNDSAQAVITFNRSTGMSHWDRTGCVDGEDEEYGFRYYNGNLEFALGTRDFTSAGQISTWSPPGV